LIASGDLTERGDEASYRRLRDKLSACPFPVHYALGNHDNRDAFGSVFPELPMRGGFLHYAVDCGDLRLLVLDTLEPGRHGGGFCAARAAWLTERLDEEPDRPTIIVLHHPPIETGIGWLTTDPAEPWVERLAAAIDGRRNIVALLCGHIHRSITARFGEFPVVVCPPTAPVAALTLAPLDPDHPDGRPIIVDTPPAYALHLWRHGQLVSHVDRIERQDVLVTYDAAMRPLMQKVFGERP
jgi:3',5'-cyclic AMP phosphodiesterase CpdA